MAGERKSVYVITERAGPEGPKSFWTKVGVSFTNRDGSITIKLDALPLSGTLQIRDDDEDKKRRGASGSAGAAPGAPPAKDDEIPF